MSVNRCDLCYELVLNPCQESYTFATGLDNTLHTMVLRDIHGNIFTEMQNPDGAAGLWTIHASMYPEGMFNQFSGSYEVYFVEGTDTDNVSSTLYINEQEYQCILIKIRKETLIYD